jgi:hypothetical protein
VPDFTEVACPTCNSPREKLCRTATGKISEYTHVARRDFWREQNPPPIPEERWVGPTDVTFRTRVYEDRVPGKGKPTLWLGLELEVHGRRSGFETPINPEALSDLRRQLNLIVAGLEDGQLIATQSPKR